MIKKFK